MLGEYRKKEGKRGKEKGEKRKIKCEKRVQRFVQKIVSKKECFCCFIVFFNKPLMCLHL